MKTRWCHLNKAGYIKPLFRFGGGTLTSHDPRCTPAKLHKSPFLLGESRNGNLFFGGKNLSVTLFLVEKIVRLRGCKEFKEFLGLLFLRS